jgi:hypothetical protein
MQTLNTEQLKYKNKQRKSFIHIAIDTAQCSTADKQQIKEKNNVWNHPVKNNAWKA